MNDTFFDESMKENETFEIKEKLTIMEDTHFDESIDRVKARAFDALADRMHNFEIFHQDALDFLGWLHDQIFHTGEVVIDKDDPQYKEIAQLIRQGYDCYHKHEAVGKIPKDKNGIPDSLK